MADRAPDAAMFGEEKMNGTALAADELRALDRYWRAANYLGAAQVYLWNNYSLAAAFGAVVNSPGLLVAGIVGDGEGEPGPTATAWHGTKYLNPARDGAVLPILRLNGYKVSSATIFGAMRDEELSDLFQGYG